ncbi:N-acetylmuramoyl-L-alanine amidase [Streptacidiphilus sp. PB12-B1b]|uniref:N-acetylmuramoyl-L-alanine amidase family protein n=1 Tax=Streptacidiphilus sp. PB12-B1b TaxID=2705012 RepID=UPI0015FADA8A|nr:N-acetylmuramoyl-L-alanine amidase [Streptacidiphilus sp. PB12-B1b]QMU77521.1 N-acetylmuramoyl-L-alanine amidase [Streptacidiphilus sp. PB12-B1b]
MRVAASWRVPLPAVAVLPVLPALLALSLAAGQPTHSGAARPVGAPAAAAGTLPLAGRTVVLDPGHNPGNADHRRQIAALVDVGNARKPCNTTGTATDSGYPEALFNLDVARRARVLLQDLGARVVLTQDGDRPWGPCVDERAAIANRAHADATVAIHGDGAPASGYGFQVILPAPVVAGIADNAAIVAPSRRLGLALQSAFRSATGEPFSTYLGGGTGFTVRSDLGGLNLARVPAVFIECGNMRNPGDAQRMITTSWREAAARGVADGIAAFLEQPGPAAARG